MKQEEFIFTMKSIIENVLNALPHSFGLLDGTLKFALLLLCLLLSDTYHPFS